MKFKKSINLLICCIMSCAIIGCETNPNGTYTKASVGTVTGALGGAIIGSAFGGGKGHFAGALIGAGAGAMIGNMIGKNMDAKDRQYQQQSYQHAMESGRSGQVEAWRNPDSGAYGSITPIKTYQSNERYCREFRQTVTIGSKQEESVGRACRNPDGTWAIVN